MVFAEGTESCEEAMRYICSSGTDMHGHAAGLVNPISRTIADNLQVSGYPRLVW